MIEKYKYQESTGRITGAAMEAHRHLGKDVKELVHKKALAVKLVLQGIGFERKKEIPLIYKGIDIGTRGDDSFIEQKIMLGIKAGNQPEEVHSRQAINYPEAYGIWKPVCYSNLVAHHSNLNAL